MNCWVVVATWAICALLAWAIVKVGSGDPIPPRATRAPRRRWRVPFRLTSLEREENRLRYGRLL